jgi:hypothetical protein
VKRFRIWATGLVLTAALVWSFTFLKDLHPLGSLNGRWGNGPLSEIGISFRNVTFVGRSRGQKVWEFKARSIEMGKDRRLATFTDVAQGHLLRDGAPIATLSSSKVVYNTITQDVSVPGKANLEIQDGLSLNVHNMYWQWMKSIMYCKGGVYAKIRNNTFHADRMVLDLKNKEISLQNVSGQLDVSQ